MLKAGSGVRVDLQNPPQGTWYATDTLCTVIGASHRAWGKALGLLGIALFWNGIVSVFVLVALSGTLNHFGVIAPEWFPAPKMNDQVMGLGMLLFLWLFLTPFIVIGSGMIIALVSTLGGRTEVRIQQGMGRVYVGVGSLGWTRRFDPAQVGRVEIGQRTWRNSDGDSGSQTEIHLELAGGKKLKFGSLLKEERQHFLVSALRQVLHKSSR